MILGGTYEKNNWSTLPNYKAAEYTLKSCFELDPLLADGGASWRDIEIIGVNVGFRPCREGGARVQLERRRLGDGWRKPAPDLPKGDRGRPVGAVHAYGFAGVG